MVTFVMNQFYSVNIPADQTSSNSGLSSLCEPEARSCHLSGSFLPVAMYPKHPQIDRQNRSSSLARHLVARIPIPLRFGNAPKILARTAGVFEAFRPPEGYARDTSFGCPHRHCTAGPKGSQTPQGKLSVQQMKPDPRE